VGVRQFHGSCTSSLGTVLIYAIGCVMVMGTRNKRSTVQEVKRQVLYQLYGIDQKEITFIYSL
jgi:hypothetical protein